VVARSRSREVQGAPREVLRRQQYDFTEYALVGSRPPRSTRKRPDDALKYLQANLEYFPKSSMTYQAMAQAKEREGRQGAAIKDLETAVHSTRRTRRRRISCSSSRVSSRLARDVWHSPWCSLLAPASPRTRLCAHNRFGETLRLLELIEPARPDVEHREGSMDRLIAVSLRKHVRREECEPMVES